MQIVDPSYLPRLTFIPINVSNPVSVNNSASKRFLVY